MTTIENIRLVSSNRNDRLIWPNERTGFMTARSAYAFLRNNQNAARRNGPSSSHQTSKAMWKGNCKINWLPKVKHFLWRVAARCLIVIDVCLKRER